MECFICSEELQKGACPNCGHINTRFFSEDLVKPLLAAGEISLLYSFDPADFNRLGREKKGRVKLVFLQKKNNVTTPMIRIYTKGIMEHASLLKVKVAPGHPLEPLLEFVKRQNFSKPTPVEYPPDESTVLQSTTATL